MCLDKWLRRTLTLAMFAGAAVAAEAALWVAKM
jgi:hypothetical protein